MKKFFLHIFLVGVLGMLTVSCNDTEMVEYLDTNVAQVVFSVAMDSPVTRTRAAEDKTWGDNYDPSDPGTAKDNRIDIDQLIVKIVDGDTEYEIIDIMKWKSGDNSYKFVGVVKDVNEAITLDNAKVYVYANMGNGSKPAETFNQNAPFIPMWGVKNVSLNFVPGKREDAGQISLLRAMAKLEVKLGGEMAAEYELTGATLNKYNNVGNTHPALPEDFNGDTENLGLETVLNVNTSSATDLALVPTEDGSSYVVYLPEVKNGTSETDWLKISVDLQEKNGTGTEEGSFFIKDYSDEDNPVAIDIIRNHWYQYTITGFAASEIQVEYNVLDWQGVEMEIGGDGFLFLSKDVVEIYNSNIDADQLTFSSSSPIKSIELVDLYNHDRDGNIVEGTGDGVSAYYISKYGQKIQLGTDPGFDITDKAAALAREQVILSNIKAEAEDNALNGGITVCSPFMADPANEKPELQQNSHNDTPRYLEFLVTNDQNLTATFRVIQYPPVVITNTEGFFSYREDFRVDIPYKYKIDQFRSEYTYDREPYDNGEAIHYLNPIPPFFTLAGFFPYHIHKWDNVSDKVAVSKGKYGGSSGKSCAVFNEAGTQIGTYISFDETPAGLYERDHMRLDEYKGAPVTSVFHRAHYYWTDGSHFISSDYSNTSKYYQNVSPPYYELEDKVITNEETGEVSTVKEKVYYVRHYTGNSFNFFYSKFVNHVYTENGKNVNGLDRYKGEADICSQLPNDEYNGWDIWAVQNANRNHRMYHIKTTAYSPTYILGWPKMTNKDGRIYTAEGEDNARMVSPSFMIASQLGTTAVPQNRDHYTVPLAEGMYAFAQRQCEQYAEAYYTDENGDGEYNPGEPVTHFKDWRLPTRAEVELIVNLQRNSRAMDKVLYGEKYFHASTIPNDYKDENTLYSLDANLDNWTTSGYQMRCVRDVKPGQNGETKTYPLNVNNE